eukprot:gene14682-19428_t
MRLTAIPVPDYPQGQGPQFTQASPPRKGELNLSSSYSLDSVTTGHAGSLRMGLFQGTDPRTMTMSREIFAYQAPDLSALARILKREIDARPEKPGHVEILNMLARAAGFRNYQHLKASRDAKERLANPVKPEPEPEVDYRRVELTARCFGGTDVLVRWPGKFNQQQLALW